MCKLIILLLCKKLGVKRFQAFQFVGQKSPTDYYMFTKDGILKFYHEGKSVKSSDVSLSWLLNEKCEVVVYETK